MSVKRAFKCRFHPTPAQADLLNRTFGCVRKVYNLALAERSRVYATERRSMTYVQSSAALTAWKKTDDLAFLNEVSSVPLQQTLRHLHAGFAAFFDKRARYPRFKSKRKSRTSAEFTASAFRWRGGYLTLAKMSEPLNIVWSRPLPEGAQPSTVTVSRDAAGRWFPSSKLCSACGRLTEILTLTVRSWTCPGCGTVHDRDVNAAKNILAAGLAER
jgi:putative transposase